MDAAVLERAYEAFQEFHGYFAPVFGRKEARENSSHYLQALLVQSEERRNAENLSETVPASSRALQRFLAESPWDDDAVIDRLQEYLSSRLHGISRECGCWTAAKQGMKSVGPAREDSQLPSRGVSGPRGGQGTGAGGQEAVSAGGMDWGRGALCDGGSAGGPTGVPKQTGAGSPAQARGHLSAQWEDSAFGMSPTAGGHRVRGYVLDVPSRYDGLAAGTHLDRSALPGQRASPQTQTAA